MNTQRTLSIFALFTLAACGGGGGGSNSSPSSATTQTVDTENIVAERDFLFQLEHKISLDLIQSGSDKGVIHIYTQLDAELDDGRLIANPTSHLTSIYPQASPSTDLIVNRNWVALYLQWTPMGNGEEKTFRLKLSPDQSQYLLQF
tara:strand:+ start:5125 stop:5562 length:438 start_codon:yes stop_codon:yes gene_type:complete